MSWWRPRSVLQLVLVGFFTALAPLCVAILFTVQTLEELTSSYHAVTRQVMDITRISQEVQAEVPEMERHVRQFLALSDPELASLARSERSALLQKLAVLQGSMSPRSANIDALRAEIEGLDLRQLVSASAAIAQREDMVEINEAMDRSFVAINDYRRVLQQDVQTSMDQLLERNAVRGDAILDTLLIQLLLLACTTLTLLLFFSYWINKPVQDLTAEIHRLGTSGLSHRIEISGPQEVAALGRKLEWLRQSLHEADQQKQQFLRHVSHELKTPLASLREGADLLAEHVTGRLSQQQQEVVDIVRHNAIELQEMIENLLDYNRLPDDQLYFERIELAELIGELLDHYRISIDRKALKLSVHGAVEAWVADRYKLKTTLDNLLSNAVNYSADGGDIDIAWRAEAASLIIDVANSGEPVPEEDAELVFQPFFQSTAQRSGPLKGSGIGLSVARDCMEAQGGSLTMVTHEILPVCFRLTCPAR